eukprot:c1009_g1_i1.p1 GENE.c1009_g1_i1~~c1009_g1_i1.p1  ORF type:complete len:543 (+),score=119.01 c1009_g1_i1:54-1631(+)
MGEPTNHQLLNKISQTLLTHHATQMERDHKSVDFKSPKEIQQQFKATTTVGLHLDVDQRPCGDEQIIEACKAVLALSVNTGGPRFFNQLYARVDATALGAEWLVAELHANVHTFEAAPVLTLVEQEVVKKLCHLIGGKYEDEQDGLFVPGGAMSNMYGLLLARHWAFPTIRTEGMSGPPLVAFVSEEGHYSIAKSASVLGIGTKHVVVVPTDENGCMDPSVLDKLIEESKQIGNRPFIVIATAGTTVVGAVDPIESIADVCEKHKLWLHVDGAWGGTLVLSKEHRHLLAGLHRADSFALCAHKMLGVPHQCSVIVTRHSDLLMQTNASHADYLFQSDKNFASCDLGDKTIQCGRRGDALKLWFLWKRLGDTGLAARVDKCIALARHCEHIILSSSSLSSHLAPHTNDHANKLNFKGRFILAIPSSFANVCFWYIPPCLMSEVSGIVSGGNHIAKLDESVQARVGQVCVEVKDRLQREGGPLVQFQKLRSWPNLFRLVFSSCDDVQQKDAEDVLLWMDRVGHTIVV